jgi:hypothetical protein
MSFKEAKELRLNGRLAEALAMATADLESDPDNVWNKRSISWVYYDYLKLHSTKEGYSDFMIYFEKLISLELEIDDIKMLHENVAIQLGKLIYALYKVNDVDYSKIDSLFEKAQVLKIGRPSKANSFLIKAFLKGSKTWSNIHLCLDFFGFDSFQESDYLSEEYNGKAISSIAEKFYNTYCKKLFDLSKAPGVNTELLNQLIQEFLPKLDLQISEHPEYQFLPYFKAKLLIQTGQKDLVLESFIPFARRKKNEFWVWEVIAELYEINDDRNFACHCKALSLSSPEEYLVGLRKDFAQMLIEKGMYPEAKFELMKLIDIRNQKGWKIGNDILQITNQSWYNETKETSSNNHLYNQFKSKAEELLFQNVEEEIVVVEFVNYDKQVLNFVKDESKHGFFSYKGLLQKPMIGDLLKVRLEGDTGRFQLLSVKKDNEFQSPAMSSFSGKVKKAHDKDFAFVDNYFIEPKLAKMHNLSNDQEISGKAILSFNKLKEKWGWKVIEINKK